jgi:hypothetical protein
MSTPVAMLPIHALLCTTQWNLTKSSKSVAFTSNARYIEIREVRPVAQLRWIPSDPHPLRNTRYTVAIKHEEHKPRRRTRVCVRRRGNGTRVPGATECREVRSLSHAITMRAAHRAHEGDLGSRAAEHGDRDCVAVPVARLVVVDQVRRLCGVAHEVRWYEDFDTVLLDVGCALGVGSGNEDTAVLQQDGFGVVEAVDSRVGEDGEAGVEGRGGVEKDGVVVGLAGEAEAREALHSAVEDQVGAVWKGRHARYDAFGRLDECVSVRPQVKD